MDVAVVEMPAVGAGVGKASRQFHPNSLTAWRGCVIRGCASDVIFQKGLYITWIDRERFFGGMLG